MATDAPPSIETDTPMRMLRLRFWPPRLPPDAIDRRALCDARKSAQGTRVFTIVGAAGFGKTTLAAQWRQAWVDEGARCAWLTITPFDDDPARLMRAVCHTLEDAAPGLGSHALALLDRQPMARHDEVAALLVEAMREHPGSLVLMLDDCHHISARSALDFIALVAAYAPTDLKLVLTSRFSLSFAFDSFQARGECLTLHASDLRFTEREIADFLLKMPAATERGVSPRRLLQQTGGWPAAVRIACLDQVLSAPAKPREHAASLNLLIDATLDSLPPEWVDLLVATAILDRFDESLCDSVMGRAGSAGLMDGLVALGLMHPPSDGLPGEVQHLRPLRSNLICRLASRPRAEVVELHRRAAQWLAGRSRWREAIPHGLAAGELTSVGGWLSRCALDLVQSGDMRTLRSWIEQLPEDSLERLNGVHLALAWESLLTMRFDEMEAHLSVCNERPVSNPHQGVSLELREHVQVVRIVAAALRDDDDEAQRLFRAWGGPARVDRWAANSAYSTERWLRWHAGDWVGMHAIPWQDSPSPPGPRDVLTESYRRMLLASAEFERGRLDVSRSHVDHVLRLSEESTEAVTPQGGKVVLAALVTPILAAICFEQGEVDAVGALVPRMLEVIESTTMLHCVMHAYLSLARTYRLRDPAGDEPFQLLRQAEHLGRKRNWSRLCSAMLLQRLDWLACDGRFDEAQACLELITRLADGVALLPRRPRSDLPIHRDWGMALLALRRGEHVRAKTLLSALYKTEHEFGNVLKSIRLGVALAHAHLLSGERLLAEQVMRACLKKTAATGAVRSLLDHGDEVIALAGALRGHTSNTKPVESLIERITATGGGDRSAPAVEFLSSRELEVLQQVAMGHPNKRIAQVLGVSPETVKSHLARIFEKLGAVDRRQAVEIAQARGLLLPTGSG